MGSLIGAAAVLAVLLWLFAPRKARQATAPEDDVTTPVDRSALEEAERELAEDPGAGPLGEDPESEEEDDWGPGAGGR